MTTIITEQAARERGWIREEGRSVSSKTADTQYYVWKSDSGELMAYQFHNDRTNHTSPVICQSATVIRRRAE
jgi:hypothetical protein